MENYKELSKSQKQTLKKNIIKYKLNYPTDFRSSKNREIIGNNLGRIEVEIEGAKIDLRREQLRQASKRYREKKMQEKQIKRWIGNVAIGVKYIRADSYTDKKGKIKVGGEDYEKDFYYTDYTYPEVLDLKKGGESRDFDLLSNNIHSITKNVYIPDPDIYGDEMPSYKDTIKWVKVKRNNDDMINELKKGNEPRDLNKENGRELKEDGIKRKVKLSLYNIPINIQSTKDSLPFYIDRKIKEYLEINKLNYAYIVKTEYDILYYNITDADNTTELSYNDIKMRERYAPKIDGYDWEDTNTGRCVFDYIKTLLGNVDGFKSICKDYDSLEKELRKNDLENLQYDGVSVSHIINFCRKYNLPLYVLGDFGKSDILYSYKPEKIHSHARTLCFRMSNNHIYPILDKNKIKSIISLKNIRDDVVSNFIEKTEHKEEEDVVNNNNIIYTSGTFEALAEIIKTKNIVPNTNNIKIKDGQIKSFKIDKDVYVRDEFIDNSKILCDLFDIDFKGQSIGGLTSVIYKDLYKEDNLPVSSYNPEVKDSLLIAKKNRGHHGFIEGKKYNENERGLKSIDINKCYRKCLYDPIDDFIVLDINDIWEDYKGDEDLQNALYMVETNDMILLKGNDIYSGAILKVAQNNNIDFKITKKLIPKRYVSKDKFKLFIDTIISKFDKYNIYQHIKDKICTTSLKDIREHKQDKNYKNLKNKIIKQMNKEYNEYQKVINKLDMDIYKQTEKLVINSLSGMLGRHNDEKIIASINNDIKQILTFISKHNIKDTYLYKLPDIDYYIYGLRHKTIKNETTIPIYLQMIDQSNIMIYELTKKIEEAGGEVLARKIDCVVCRNLPSNFKDEDEDNDKKTIYDDFGNNWGDYRFDDKLPKLFDEEKKLDKTFTFQDWTIHDDISDSSDYEKIIEKLTTTNGMLIEGRAGTGKSYIIHKITEHFGDKKVLKLAFTNKASLNICGSTIHRTLGINKNEKISKKMINKVKNYDYIIIDEISMLNKPLWNLIYLLKCSLPDKCFILLGDYRQVVGIENNKNDILEDYFNHPCVKYICNYNKITLNKIHRYDNELLELSNNIYDDIDVDISKYTFKLNARRNICYFNNTRKRVNEYWNNKEKTVFSIFIPQDPEDNYTQDMYIYENCPIISRVNTYDENSEILYANSETFNVISVNNKYIYLQNEMNNSLKVEVKDFNKNFALNYCTTTHKTQGETITEDFNIYDWDFMDKKLKYTAITRAKDIKNIGIVS